MSGVMSVALRQCQQIKIDSTTRSFFSVSIVMRHRCLGAATLGYDCLYTRRKQTSAKKVSASDELVLPNSFFKVWGSMAGKGGGTADNSRHRGLVREVAG